MMIAIRWIKQFGEKNYCKVCRAYLKDWSLAYCNATQYGIDLVTG